MPFYWNRDPSVQLIQIVRVHCFPWYSSTLRRGRVWFHRCWQVCFVNCFLQMSELKDRDWSVSRTWGNQGLDLGSHVTRYNLHCISHPATVSTTVIASSAHQGEKLQYPLWLLQIIFAHVHQKPRGVNQCDLPQRGDSWKRKCCLRFQAKGVGFNLPSDWWCSIFGEGVERGDIGGLISQS